MRIRLRYRGTSASMSVDDVIYFGIADSFICFKLTASFIFLSVCLFVVLFVLHRVWRVWWRLFIFPPVSFSRGFSVFRGSLCQFLLKFVSERSRLYYSDLPLQKLPVPANALLKWPNHNDDARGNTGLSHRGLSTGARVAVTRRLVVLWLQEAGPSGRGEAPGVVVGGLTASVSLDVWHPWKTNLSMRTAALTAVAAGSVVWPKARLF